MYFKSKKMIENQKLEQEQVNWLIHQNSLNSLIGIDELIKASEGKSSELAKKGKNSEKNQEPVHAKLYISFRNEKAYDDPRSLSKRKIGRDNSMIPSQNHFWSTLIKLQIKMNFQFQRMKNFLIMINT